MSTLVVGLVLLSALIHASWNAMVKGKTGDPLVASTGAPTAGGELLLTPDLTQAAVAVHGLPPLPPDRSYQVWFNRPDGTWVSGGVFGVSERGGADVLVRRPESLPVYDACWITEEPGGGSPFPTGQRVLASALT